MRGRLIWPLQLERLHDACMSVLIYRLGMTSELDTVWLVL